MVEDSSGLALGAEQRTEMELTDRMSLHSEARKLLAG
jgi:hypothetical protein